MNKLYLLIALGISATQAQDYAGDCYDTGMDSDYGAVN